jgi:type VI secretion system protein ImpH
MATAQRGPDPPVTERLFAEYYRFTFFQAVTLLEQMDAGKEKIGSALSPGDEGVRFVVNPGFSFPPSDIKNLKPAGEAGPAQMEVAFMGLIGPAGVLPNWYNELAQERLAQKDPALVAFFNMFHHRLISLFYLAWKRFHFPVSFQAGVGDRFSAYLLSLMGLGTPHLSGRIGLPEESLIYSCGTLSRQAPSTGAIESTVTYYSGEEAVIDQFVERTLSLPAEDRTRLGLANAELGVSALCGSQVLESQTKFRIKLGPMSFPSFLRFLPSGDMLRPICSLVRYLVGIEYDFELRAIVKRAEVPCCRLGVATVPGAGRLGWTCWLKAPGAVQDCDPFVTFQESDVAAG